MLVAQDFRDRARAALNGKWAVAVGTGLVASLLGARTAFSGGGSSGGSSSSSDLDSYETLFSGMSEEVIAALVVTMLVIIGISLLWSLAIFVIGGPISLGYIKFNLGLVDGENVQFKDLFSQFSRFGEGFLVQLLRSLFIWLWTMAFVLPLTILAIIIGVAVAASGASEEAIGIVVVCIAVLGTIPASIFVAMKQYSYAMAPYILYENPGMGANQAIKASKELMNGNKWRLFCLAFSFIGWSFLCIFTCGIGILWLKPYEEAAFAAFYREIKRERYGEPIPVVDSNINPYEEGNVWGNNFNN